MGGTFSVFSEKFARKYDVRKLHPCYNYHEKYEWNQEGSP